MELINIFDYTLVHATIRATTPILFAALAAVITQQADIINVGTEGIMLVGAFIAVCVSFYTGSWILAIIAAMLAGVVFALIMAVANIEYNADICAIGIAINLLALALTRFLLKQLLGATGTFFDPKISAIPKIHFDFLESNKYLNSLFNDYSILEIFGIIAVIIFYFILYKTVWGLRLRATGKFSLATETAGINIVKMKYQVMIISGILGGLAGAHLSIGYSQLFTENMTNGRGFMGVAAMFFGNANPILSWIGCLLFGFIDSIGARLQSYGLPSQFILMLPYIITIFVLSISMIHKKIKEIKSKSSLNNLNKKQF